MNTDEMLSRVKNSLITWEGAKAGSRAEWEAAEAFTRAFAELDDALRGGAELPAQWQHKTDLLARAYSGGSGRLPLAQGNSGPGGEPASRNANEETGELRAQIARLTAELDAVQKHKVLLCTDRQAGTAMLVSVGEEPGTILRTTDTMRAWELGSDHHWRPRA